MCNQQLATNSDFLDDDLKQVSESPTKYLGYAALVFIISAFFTVICFGAVHWKCDAFTQKQLKEKLQNMEGNDFVRKVNEKLQKHDVRKKQIDKEKRQIDDLLVMKSDEGLNQQSDSLVRRKEQLNSESNNEPVILAAFLPNTLNLAWPIIYTALGWLIFVIPPYSSIDFSRKTFKSWSIISLSLYLLVHWPAWTRIFVFGDEEKVVAAINPKVSPPLFFCEELVVFTFFALLALVWVKWLNYFRNQRDLTWRQDENGSSVQIGATIADRLGKTFALWQLSSLILAFGFLSFTFLFWHSLFVIKDNLAIAGAIMIHVLWAITWLIISLPLIITWYDWYNRRMHWFASIAFNVTEEAKSVAEIQMKALQEIQPIPLWNVLVTGVASISGFILSLLKIG